MDYINLRNLLIILIVSSLNQRSDTQTIPYGTVVSFGDSNTDTGNVYKLTNYSWPPVPPYFRGRLTDGPTWIERLNASKLIDYAYEGAATDDNIVQGYGAMDLQRVPGVRQQIIVYFNQTRKEIINFDQTLYFIWSGLNDYFFNETISPITIAISLVNAVKDLISIGALNIVVLNQPPLQLYPFIPSMNQNLNFTAFTIQLNNNLSSGIALLQRDRPKLSLKVFDLYSLMSKVISNGTAYGINNTVNPCMNMTKNGTVLRACISPTSYVFFDEYHFTSRIHELIAYEVRQFISTSSANNNVHYSKFILYCCSLSFIYFQYSSSLSNE